MTKQDAIARDLQKARAEGATVITVRKVAAQVAMGIEGLEQLLYEIDLALTCYNNPEHNKWIRLANLEFFAAGLRNQLKEFTDNGKK